jgi:biopolymer transport protein ExbD
MVRKRSKIQEQEADVDMTPMLDIVFILLIFFIVTTSFIKEEGFVVNKPKASSSNQNNTQNIVIHVNENDTIFFNNSPVDLTRIPARVENFLATQSTENVVLSPHKKTNYNTVVKILDQLKPFSQLSISIGTYKG